MSELAQISPGCIPADPDISGVGIRASIYAQNFFALALAFFTMTDSKFTKTEARIVAIQSRMIILTGCALLLSAFVQAKTFGMSTYHAVVTLNLGWVNSSNTFLHLFLYYYNLFTSGTAQDDEEQTLSPSQSRDAAQGQSDLRNQDPAQGTVQSRRSFLERMSDFLEKNESEKILIVFEPAIIGSLHFTILSAFGLWFWGTFSTFGAQVQCQPNFPIPIQILGHTIMVTSPVVRKASLVIYSALVIPFFNLIPIIIALYAPVLFLCPCIPFFCFLLAYTSGPTAPRLFFYFWCTVILVMDIMIAVVTESMIQQVESVVQPGESRWTYGQTLALFLLCLPVVDFFYAIRELTKPERDRMRREIRRMRRMGMSRAGGTQVEEGTRPRHGLGQREERPSQDTNPFEREGDQLEEELDSFCGLPRLFLRGLRMRHRRLQQNLSQGEADAPAAPEASPRTSSPLGHRNPVSSQHNDINPDTSTS
ncbi:hypothetical protein D9756_003473 [Leucocoprinus leucothites]|uniref:Uncharacterized protein n=1 Tax=Leucocoprinus leucothites TaxID=201217 RepID=A0A8H5LJB8_9AGAR|nr:hypothetical protein D9756_003473 [Leucoagaricus leucothites]